jgi:DivIVA domain-containing protein
VLRHSIGPHAIGSDEYDAHHDFRGQAISYYDSQLFRPHADGRVDWLLRAVAVAVAFDPPTPQWARHAPSLAIYLVVVASVSAGLVYRGWRTGVRFDSRGLTICSFFGTRRIGWDEVSRFADGRTAGMGEGAGKVWALDVVLRDGRVVTVKATARDSSSAASKVLTEVLQAAECYGIQAPLIVVVSKRRSRTGVEEHPLEPALSPGGGGIVLSDWAASRDFSTTRLWPGYDIEEVDAFVEAIRQTFLGIREPPLTAEEIRIKRFATTRLRPGYDEEEVDAFLTAVELRLATSAILTAVESRLVPRHPTFALSPTGTCVARSTRVEEDGFAGGPSVGCAGGPLP